MARPGRLERNRAARSFRQLRRFHHVINSNKVFGTHNGSTDEEQDLLFAWATAEETKSAILFDEEADMNLVSRVINEGYAPDLTDDEIVQIGRDPFLIAYALVSPANRCVVTTEVSAPRKVRQNRHVPDLCRTMGVLCCNTFAMSKALGFKTGWAPE